MVNQFEKEYKKLNFEQKEAVDQIFGPVMVLAGPGTGKTQVIAMRVANILRKTDTNPYNILCLTFTNSGVRAMRDRLVQVMGVDGYKVVIHTFHSFCSEVISIYPERFVFARRIEQITDLEKIVFMKGILDSLENIKLLRPTKSPYYFLPKIVSQISNLKREGFDPMEFEKKVLEEKNDFAEHEEYYHQKGRYQGKLKGKYAEKLKVIEKNIDLARIFAEYQRYLDENGKYDFDDMILKVIKEFESDFDFLADFQERFLFLMVDEYQDTNGAQNRLIKLLARNNDQPNIFVVGDNDQSIYRFQGASLENLLFFADEFENIKTINLKNCYRCSESILGGARQMMANDQNKIEDFLNIKKEYTVANKYSEKIRLAGFDDGEVETIFIAEKIKEIAKGGGDLNKVAIFYRNNNESENLVEVLDKYEIRWRMSKGGNVLDSRDVVKLINILKYIDNTKDDQLLFKIMHYDFLHLETIDIHKLFAECPRGKAVFDFIVDKIESFDLRDAEGMKKWVKTMMDLQKAANDDVYISYVEKVMNTTGLIKGIDQSEGRFDRLTDLKSFYNFIKELNRQDRELDTKKLINDLDEMIENGLIIGRTNLDFDGRAVNLMTAHGAKGLEFETVFIYKCIDGHWSNKKSRDVLPVIDSVLSKGKPEENVSEERRLFYVAMTRAKKNLFLTWSKKYTENNMTREANKSMFLIEIGSDWVEELETKKYHKFANDWLEKFFDNKKKHIFVLDREYVKTLLLEYRLSPTGLNKYLKCPRKFFYEDILRVPRAKTSMMAFGTAIHSALENFYIDYKKKEVLPSSEVLIKYFEIAIQREVMNKTDMSAYLKEGTTALSGYYQKHKENLKIPLYNEFSFSRGRVILGEGMVLTGKIDRVELIEGSNERVRVIDYKTSKPKSRNQILGMTGEKDKDYWRQLVFYRLLGDLAGYFVFKIREVELDFVLPDDRGIYHRETFLIDQKDIDLLKEEIKTVWKGIQDMKFDCCHEKKYCQNHFEKCEYFDLCHGK